MATTKGRMIIDRLGYEPRDVAKHWRDPRGAAALLFHCLRKFAEVQTWTMGELEATVRGVAAARGMALGDVANPLRLALLGQSDGPGIWHVLVLLNRNQVMTRLDDAVRFLTAKGHGRLDDVTQVLAAKRGIACPPC